MTKPGTKVEADQIYRNDVLLGRGSGPNDHIGNINFRKLISTRRKEYNGTNARVEKGRIAKEIIDYVHSLDPPGRFLEKLDRNSTSWVVVKQSKALEKAKQALRQNRRRNSLSMSSTRDSPSSGSPVQSPVRSPVMSSVSSTKLSSEHDKPSYAAPGMRNLPEVPNLPPISSVSPDTIISNQPMPRSSLVNVSLT